MILVYAVDSYWVVMTFGGKRAEVEQLRINSTFERKLKFFHHTAEKWEGPCSSVMFFYVSTDFIVS